MSTPPDAGAPWVHARAARIARREFGRDLDACPDDLRTRALVMAEAQLHAEETWALLCAASEAEACQA